MFRLLLAITAGAVAVSLPIAASGAPGSLIKPEVRAKVSARSIALTDTQGQRVQTLYPQEYRFVVKDATKVQNFHLVGPGVNLRTKVGATAATTWSVTLHPGRYVYRSDRSSKLRGTFKVTRIPPM
jgi:hypothetical protein